MRGTLEELLVQVDAHLNAMYGSGLPSITLPGPAFDQLLLDLQAQGVIEEDGKPWRITYYTGHRDGYIEIERGIKP